MYAVELKLGLHDKKNAKKTYRNFFEKKYWCCIQKRKNKEYLKGNMCCLLSRLWEPKTSSKDLYINEDEKTLKVDLESWFLIVRNNSIKDMLPKKDHCTILSLEEIIYAKNKKINVIIAPTPIPREIPTNKYCSLKA